MLITTEFNGINLDEEIAGFHTLSVNGRQFPVVSAVQRDLVGNGSEFISKRYTERIIEVSFMIKANNRADMLNKQNQLLNILQTDPARLIFSDEPDKYYTAFFSGSDLEQTKTARSGVLVFTCPDPTKHSLYKKEYTGTLQNDGTIELQIENEGTVPTDISYEIVTNDENGYIGIVSNNGAMEFGNIEEADTASGVMSEMIFNYTGTQLYNALDKTKSNIPSSYALGGSFGVDGDWMKLSNKGSGSGWHGAGGQLTLQTACKDFKLTYKPYFATHKTQAQEGTMFVTIGDEVGEIMCYVHIIKKTTGNNNAKLWFKVGNTDLYSEEYVCWGTGGDPAKGGYTNESAPEIYFSKNGELFEICFHGVTHQYRVPEFANKKAKTVNLYIGAYGSITELTFMRFKYLKFVQNNVEYYYDIPNRYQPGDVIQIDGEKGTFSVNGNEQMQDEVLGSEYFKANPGMNTVQVATSSFCQNKPTVKAYVREAWL